MNILVNAISIKEGGSLVVLRKLVLELSVARPDYCWFVAVSKDDLFAGEELLPNVKLLISPWAEKSAFHLYYWYEMYVSKVLSEKNISLFYSLTNYLPFRKLKIPSLLLVQHAGHFSSVFDQLATENMSFIQYLLWIYKKQWVRKSIKNSAVLTVQTKSLANQIIKLMPNVSQPVVIAHGPGLSLAKQAPRQLDKNRLVLGYITKYGVQKNFSVVLKSIKKLVSLGFNPLLKLTLNESHPEVRKILEEIAALHISDNVKNYGEVNQDEIQTTYHQLDIFLFPSLVESFGMPMLEAMSAGLPVIAADTPVNREILGNKAMLFSEDNENELCEFIINLVGNPQLYQSAVNDSLERIKSFNWKRSAEKNIQLIDEMLNNRCVANL